MVKILCPLVLIGGGARACLGKAVCPVVPLEVVASGKTKPQQDEMRRVLQASTFSLFEKWLAYPPPVLGLFLWSPFALSVDYIYKRKMLLRKNTYKVVHTILYWQVVPVQVCGMGNRMVFQTVVPIKLLIQDGGWLRQSMKIILPEGDYSRTKMHQKNSSHDAGVVGILTGFLLSVKYYAIHSYKNEFSN